MLILLTNGSHSNELSNGQDSFLFEKNGNIVLCDNPGLTKIFGCDAIKQGYRKRPFNESELEHQARYNEGKPYPWQHKLWTVYKVDWTQFDGKPIPGTRLLRGGTVTSNNLSDATIWKFAVDRENNCVVSYIATSYWVSDKDDIPRWEKSLFNRYPDMSLIED